jgi:hypothetical protein
MRLSQLSKPINRDLCVLIVLVIGIIAMRWIDDESSVT